MLLTGEVAADASAIRAASDGGAHCASALVGGAGDPRSTLAALMSSSAMEAVLWAHDRRPARPLDEGQAQ